MNCLPQLNCLGKFFRIISRAGEQLLVGLNKAQSAFVLVDESIDHRQISNELSIGHLFSTLQTRYTVGSIGKRDLAQKYMRNFFCFKRLIKRSSVDSGMLYAASRGSQAVH